MHVIAGDAGLVCPVSFQRCEQYLHNLRLQEDAWMGVGIWFTFHEMWLNFHSPMCDLSVDVSVSFLNL